MKLGTFVGQESVTLTLNEINEVKKEIKAAIKQHLSDLENNLEYTILYQENETYDHKKKFNVFINFKNEVFLRDRHRNLIKPSMIMLEFRKEKGYDEAEVGRFYTWPKGFKPKYDKTSYECHVNLFGDCRLYKHRHISQGIGLTATDFQYGTEIEDFDFFKGLKHIANYLNSSTKTKDKF